MEIMGLPLHPLVVHAVVVLVPLAALGGIAISVWSAARKRYGWLTVAFAFAGAASTLVAQKAGEALAASLPQHSPLLEAHIAIGGQLLVWVILLFLSTLAVMISQRLIDRQQPSGRIARLVAAIVTVATAVISVVQVARIGHAGATAVWG
ncbi:MAG: hypothetical protein QM650_16180 [Microlunatus sp.]